MKQREGALKLTASYTWSRLDGQRLPARRTTSTATSPARNVYLYGPSPYDRRHEVRASAAYQVEPRGSRAAWSTTTTRARPTAGSSTTRTPAGTRTTGPRVGSDPGRQHQRPRPTTASLRLPDIQKLNLQLRANLLPVTGINLDVFADVINVMALRTTTAVYVEDGPLFGQPSARLDPFRIRLGARYRY